MSGGLRPWNCRRQPTVLYTSLLDTICSRVMPGWVRSNSAMAASRIARSDSVVKVCAIRNRFGDGRVRPRRCPVSRRAATTNPTRNQVLGWRVARMAVAPIVVFGDPDSPRSDDGRPGRRIKKMTPGKIENRGNAPVRRHPFGGAEPRDERMDTGGEMEESLRPKRLHQFHYGVQSGIRLRAVPAG